jgi:hypothetical protein
MKLSEIHWPVFSLGKITPLKEEGVIFTLRMLGNNKILRIIDDTSIDKPSLALRRVELLSKGVTLFPIKRAFYFLGDFVKVSKPNVWFIDSSGRLFKHTKTRLVKLRAKKITKVIKHVGSISIEVDGIPHRFSSLYPPDPKQKYAGIAYMDGMRFLYGYYEEAFKDTHRKV